MPMTEQDARALTYLARRLRDETLGAAAWDEPGTHAVVAKLVGQNLAIAIERVTRHAADADAKTPGAIQRPFIPDVQPATSNRDNPPKHERCSVCSLSEARCKSLRTGNPELDHDYEPATADRKRGPDAMAAIVTDLRNRKEPTTATEPEEPPMRDHDTCEEAITTALARGNDGRAEFLASRCDDEHGPQTAQTDAEEGK